MTEAEWLASDDPAAMLAYLATCERLPGPLPPSPRKLRLFACACCRLVRQQVPDERSRRAVEVAERYADGAVSLMELDRAWEAAFSVYGLDQPEHDPLRHLAAACATRFPVTVMADLGLFAPAWASLLRDIVGNPFRPVTLPTRNDHPDAITLSVLRRDRNCPWLTPLVLGLARTAYGYGPCGRCKDERFSGFFGSDSLADAFAIELENRRCPDCRGTGEALGPFNPTLLPILADALEDAGATEENAADLLRHLRRPPDCRACDNTGAGTDEYNGSSIIPGGCPRCGGEAGPHARGCWVVDLVLGKE